MNWDHSIETLADFKQIHQNRAEGLDDSKVVGSELSRVYCDAREQLLVGEKCLETLDLSFESATMNSRFQTIYLGSDPREWRERHVCALAGAWRASLTRHV